MNAIASQHLFVFLNRPGFGATTDLTERFIREQL